MERLAHAFAGWQELVAFAEIDIVTVTITVPQHLAVVKAALAAGKHVYCEAPLGNGLAEAEEMAGLARKKGVVAVTDQVLVQARLANGAPLSLHSVGGMPKVAAGFVWDIHGSLGDIRVTAPFGHAQMAQLSLLGAKTGETAMGTLAVPERFAEGAMPGPRPGNVARNYARMFRDIRTGSRTASTFDDAVGVQKVIEAIRDAAKIGKRVRVDAPNRPLPLPQAQ